MHPELRGHRGEILGDVRRAFGGQALEFAEVWAELGALILRRVVAV
ncbi:hypothetical protein GS444_24220 [Rhodococcus hoagii]|nr:hypothetical protein [Prescottella equi]